MKSIFSLVGCMIWLGHLQSQALFELPDSLKLKDTLMVRSWDDMSYEPFQDSTDAYDAHRYRVTRMRPFSNISLGNNGSESISTVFNLDKKSGFRSGYNGYQAYRWSEEDIRFYDANIAYSVVAASLGNSFANSSTSLQENAQANAFFTRNFAHRVNVSLDYRNINEKGIYTRDQSKHTQVRFQINQHSKNQRFFWYGSWIRNAFNRQLNGGSNQLDLLTDSLYVIRENIPVRFENGGNRDASNDFSLGWKWSTSSSVDHGLQLENRTSYSTRNYKFYLSEVSELDSFYLPFPRDTLGLRNAYQWNELSNDMAIGWHSTIFESIKVGYRLSRVEWDQNPIDETWYYGTLHGDLRLQFGESVSLDLHAYVETLEEAGDFKAEGDLQLQWKNIGSLAAQGAIGRQSPSFEMTRLVFNENMFYRRDLDAYNYLELGGTLDIEKLGITLGVKQTILNNYSYFDSTFEVATNADVLAVTELRAGAKWKLFGGWHLKNQFQYNIMDDQVFILPNWQSRHTLFYQGKIKKNGMIYRLGLEGEVRQMTYRPRFVPFLQHFIPSDEVNDINGLIHRLDPYAQFDISTFSIFLKAENIQSLWWGKPFVPVLDRPVFDWMFRLGITWKLLN